MRNIETTKGESLAVGDLPEGCRKCIAGRKSVLFVTGKCNQKCWYCTISEGRWQKDITWINEKLVRTDDDIVNEIRLSDSKGMGITGGEPLLFPDRVVHYIKLVKKEFGKNFHVHIYTSGIDIDPKILKQLHEAGLDEIRIHTNKELVKEASKYGWKFGMEVPCIPGDEKKLCELVDFLDELGADVFNLNELEFSERNIPNMKQYDLKDNSLTAVEGSEETAKKVLEYARSKKLNVHYCTAALKMNYQLRNRLYNRATNIRKPFEKVNKDGMLLKGVIIGDTQKILAKLKKLGVKEDQFFVNPIRGRVDTSIPVAKRLRKSEFKVAVVEEYPTEDPWDFELTPLN